MENEEFKEKVDEIVAKAKIFAEQASKKASELAVIIGEKTGQLFDAAKKKIEIEKIEYALSKKYKELGKAYYEAKTQSKDCSLDDLCTQIATLNDALDVLNTVEYENETEKTDAE